MEVVEKSTLRNSYLDESESFEEGESGHLIHGVALGHRDITRSESGAELYWTADALQMAASGLEGRPLVVDHEDSAYNVVGEIEQAKFEENVGIVYEARLTDDELADKIQDDLLEVSVHIYRPADDKLASRGDGTLEVDKAKIDNLSIVPVGEAPSNYVEYGEAENFSEEECLSVLSGDTQETEYEEIASKVAEELDSSLDEVLEAIENLEESGSGSVSEGDEEKTSDGSEAPDDDESDSILADVLGVN